MKLIIIAAFNNKRVIGKNGKIPWHIPEDLQRFKELTTNHTVLMGRKTFESIGKPLSNRINVVLSKNKNVATTLKPDSFKNDIEIFSSIESALSRLHEQEKVFIIGGGEVFHQTIDRTDEFMLTLVNNDDDGDTFFPVYDHLVGTNIVLENQEHYSGFSFLLYKKIS